MMFKRSMEFQLGASVALATLRDDAGVLEGQIDVATAARAPEEYRRDRRTAVQQNA
jgi:hypothetical protein